MDTQTHFLFLLIALIPVVLFDVVGLKWLHVPWLPLGVLGTAVVFIVSFKNNASYDRLWEARKIWGGIVNASRSWTIMVKDFITNAHAKKERTDVELQTIKRELVHRHIAWLTALRYQLRQDKPWEFHTMEAIGENTKNPFEGGPNDVLITDMSRGIEIDICQLIDDTDIPEPFVWKNDIVI